MITPLSRSTGCLVEKYINSDFDHVVNVAEHMDQIKNVEANQANIDNVSDHMTQVVNVSNNMEHVVAVSTDMETVKAVHADEVDIGKVADNITEVVQVANGMEEYQVIEHYTLEQGQTTVQLDNILAQTAKVEVTGQMVDGTVLLRNTDFTVTAIKRIDLTRSYPKGTIIKVTQVVYKNQDDPYIVIDELSAFNRKTLPIGIDVDISPYDYAGGTVTPRLLVKSISYVAIDPIPSNTLITSVNVTSEPEGIIVVRTTNGDIRFSSVLAEAFTREEIGKAVTITHPYFAVGGESTINVPYLFDNVQAVYINGLRQVKDYSWEWKKEDGRNVTIAEELLNGDLVEVIIGGEYEQLLPPDIELSDVFGVPVFDLVNGLVISPNQANNYPKLKAFNAIYELADNSVSYTVKSFSQSVDSNSVTITLNTNQQVSAQKVDSASKYWVQESFSYVLESTSDFSKVQGHFKIGQKISTKGFYQPHDRGGAEYLVVSNVTPDNKLSFDVGNGLTADLIVKDRTIPARQVGVRGVDDVSSLVAVRNRYAGWDANVSRIINLDISDVKVKLVTRESGAHPNEYGFRLISGMYIVAKNNPFFNGSEGGVIELAPAPARPMRMGITTITDKKAEIPFQNNCGLQGVVVTANSNVEIGVLAAGCQFGCDFSNLVFNGDFKVHAMLIAKSWTATYKNIYVNKSAGCGVTIGKHPHTFYESVETDFAVNGITFSDFTVENCGSLGRFVLNSEEHLDYGLGIYGTMHSCDFNGITFGHSYGSSFVDHLSYGSYKFSGQCYVENVKDHALLFSTPNGVGGTSSYVRADINGINLQTGCGITVKKNGNSYKLVEVQFGVGNNNIVIHDGVSIQNFRIKPSSDITMNVNKDIYSRDKIFEKKINLKDWTAQEFVTEAHYLGINPQVKVYFIPLVDVPNARYVVQWWNNGVKSGAEDGFNQQLKAYEPVQIRGLNISNSARIIKMEVRVNSVNCEGYLVGYNISRDIK